MQIKLETDFSLDDLLALVQKKEGEQIPEGYLTTQQWAEWAGKTYSWSADFLNRAFRSGVLDSQRIPMACRDGVMRRVPAYKFIFQKGE